MLFSRPVMRQPAFWLIVVALLLLGGCDETTSNTPSSTSDTFLATTPGIRPFADTWGTIRTFLDFDYNVPDPAAAAHRYDFAWGVGVDHVAEMRAANPNIFLTYYFPFYRDGGTFTDITPRSLDYWKTTHPDWILYRCDRVTPAFEPDIPNVPLDFSNPALVAWQVATYAQPASENNYDGIAADNVDLRNLFGACGVYNNGQWVQLYTGQPDDPQWRANIVAWLTRMQSALHHLRHPLALIPNLALDGVPPTDQVAQQVLKHVDGILDEGGFTNYGMGYLTDEDWVQTIQFIEQAQRLGKPYYEVNQFLSVGRAEVQWALASYLMSKDHLAELFITTIQGYGVERWYQEYAAQLGNPTGPMHQTQNVYIRPYSRGVSIVNPSATESYTVTLDGGPYHDLYGNPIERTITLSPHSGMVLLADA
jgi:hypothetical protein